MKSPFFRHLVHFEYLTCFYEDFGLVVYSIFVREPCCSLQEVSQFVASPGFNVSGPSFDLQGKFTVSC